jgi:hypothetical protein
MRSEITADGRWDAAAAKVVAEAPTRPDQASGARSAATGCPRTADQGAGRLMTPCRRGGSGGAGGADGGGVMFGICGAA